MKKLMLIAAICLPTSALAKSPFPLVDFELFGYKLGQEITFHDYPYQFSYEGNMGSVNGTFARFKKSQFTTDKKITPSFLDVSQGETTHGVKFVTSQEDTVRCKLEIVNNGWLTDKGEYLKSDLKNCAKRLFRDGQTGYVTGYYWRNLADSSLTDSDDIQVVNNRVKSRTDLLIANLSRYGLKFQCNEYYKSSYSYEHTCEARASGVKFKVQSKMHNLELHVDYADKNIESNYTEHAYRILRDAYEKQMASRS